MRERSDKTIKKARRHLSEWLRYCHHRSGLMRPRLNGRVLICTGCAFDAIAAAIEDATQSARKQRRRRTR